MCVICLRSESYKVSNTARLGGRQVLSLFMGELDQKERLTTTDLPRRRGESLQCWSMLLQSAFPSCLRSLALVCKPAEDGESCNSLFILHISILAGDGVSLEGLKNRGRWLLASFIPWPDSYHRVPSPRLCLEKAVRFQRLSITFNWPAWFSAAGGVSPVI